MSRTLKEVRENLLEAAEATKTNLQYIRAKTAKNDHFETRRYIAAEILRDKKLADAYNAITIRQRLEKMMMADLKRKIKNWDEVYSAL